MEHLVRVSWHAVQRLRLRFPREANGEEASNRRFIAGEVVEAIAAGRMATHIPRFAVAKGVPPSRRGRSRQVWRSRRFVWTADEARLYVIYRTDRLTTVLTVIKPGVDDTEADVNAAA